MSSLGVAAIIVAGPLAADRPVVDATPAASPLCQARTVSPVAGEAATGPTLPDPVRHPRLQRWAISSEAMSGAAIAVNVLLPAGYSPATAVPYKVLYLLHGHGGGADDWWKKADAAGTPLEQLVGSLPVIVVMPDGGYDGWYSDWYGVDIDGHNGTDPNRAPAWETFHIDELIPFIDAHYPTQADRDGRLIAGLSMGGFGAMSYAARHPKLFSIVGSFSGALDTQIDNPVGTLAQAEAQNLSDRKAPDNCIWGNAITQAGVWAAHNPAAQVAALEGKTARVAVYASAGDGCAPSPSNPDLQAPARCQASGLVSPGNANAAFNEWGIRQESQSFSQKLEALCAAQRCAPRKYDFYSPGIHDWRYWLPELRSFLTWAHGLGAV